MNYEIFDDLIISNLMSNAFRIFSDMAAKNLSSSKFTSEKLDNTNYDL